MTRWQKQTNSGGRWSAGLDLRRADQRPTPETATRGGVPTIVQATLFYLEAATLGSVLAIFVGILVFTLLAQLSKFFGIEQSGDTLNIALWGLVAVAGLATFLTAFIIYFRLLAKPVAGRILCALGSLIWALPVGLAAPILLHRIVPSFSVLATWIVYLGVAAVLYWLKRRIIGL